MQNIIDSIINREKTKIIKGQKIAFLIKLYWESKLPNINLNKEEENLIDNQTLINRNAKSPDLRNTYII